MHSHMGEFSPPYPYPYVPKGARVRARGPESGPSRGLRVEGWSVGSIRVGFVIKTRDLGSDLIIVILEHYRLSIFGFFFVGPSIGPSVGHILYAQMTDFGLIS